MPAAMTEKVYNDYEWVAKEYLRCSRAKMWNIETTKDTLKYFIVERSVEVDLHGTMKPAELTMENLLKESEYVEATS